jgi:Uncharacterised protein family (UPF0158)
VTLLDPEQVDLADLALALEDNSHEHSWWLDPATGRLEPHFRDDLGEVALDEGQAARLISVEPLPPAVGYGDMKDFVAFVREPSTRATLERALAGRGAFRRFKDSLLEHPELRRAWFEFHDARGERRAIEWLLDRGLVEPASADAAIARRPEPEMPDLPGLLDAEGVAQRVAGDLRRLYRERLRGVILFGPWARGDAHPEAAVELLVVLDEVGDHWEEKRRMDRVMWRHSVRNDTVVTETPVAEAELGRAAIPLLARARREGLWIE